MAVTSTNPAKLFGLWPDKGSLQVGADADLYVLDPEKEFVVASEQMESASDFDPYEGYVAKGWPVLTLSRGELVVRDGEVRSRTRARSSRAAISTGGNSRPEARVAMARHELLPVPGQVTDVFRADAEPVLVVASGDELSVTTLDAWGHLEPQEQPGSVGPLMFEARRGHCLAGPIAVEGARPGSMLAVHLQHLEPVGWGWTSSGAHDTELNRRLDVLGQAPTWLLWEIDVEEQVARCQLDFSVGLSPFLGVVGLPPDEPGEHSTIPRASGGNIDCKELVAGSTVYLPVTVPGALLCLGDGHAAQGDGEVSGTAIECGMTTELAVEARRLPDLPMIHTVTPVGRVTFGFSADLNEAATEALDAMVRWMEGLLQLSRPEALALASVAVDLRVTQVVNRTWGVHAVLENGRLG